MIIVKGRELLIPGNERYIGTTYDDNSTVRTFRIPRFHEDGIDKSQLDFYVIINYDDGSDPGAVGVVKAVNDDYIVLEWDVGEDVTEHSGCLYLWVRGFDHTGTVRWSSFPGVFYIETSGTEPSDLSDLEERISEEDKLIRLAKLYKSQPMTAATAAEMINREQIYVYVGDEEGYQHGHWYFWDGSAWVPGGVYNSIGLQTDKELIAEDVAADAKAVGYKLTNLQNDINVLDTQVDGIMTLARFDGDTDEQRIYDALITKGYRGAIYGGNITINSSIALPNATVRETKITNAVITLNADMFTAASGNRARLPSFVNCKFIGNGHAIYGSNYAVFGDFIGCSFVDCALINNTSGTVQIAYMYACEVLNNTVPFIRANNLYDVKIDGMVCEAQSATLIDTINSTGEQGGPRNLWITNSIFEGFTNLVFNLAGGGPGVFIQRCYFEANALGCLYLKKSNDGYDYLMLEISDCKVNSDVTPFEISGFTNNYRVKVSVHDNYYYTSVTGTPMVKGIPVDDMFTVYNNRPSYTTDVFSDQARYIYKPEDFARSGVDSSYFSYRSGGFIQFGRLVFVNMYLKATATTAANINNALTGMPKPHVSRVRLEVRNQEDESLYSNKYVLLSTADPASGTFVGGTTVDDGYIIKGFYFTTNKAVY